MSFGAVPPRPSRGSYNWDASDQERFRMSDAAADVPDSAPDHNRTGVDFRRAMPRPKVNGIVIDFHCHLHAARHGKAWFEAAEHYGIDCFVTMTPLEEAVGSQRDHGARLHFIAVPKWREYGQSFVGEWLKRIEAFHNIGSRIVKFWVAPPAVGERKWRLDSEMFRPLLREVRARGMAV